MEGEEEGRKESGRGNRWKKRELRLPGSDIVKASDALGGDHLMGARLAT